MKTSDNGVTRDMTPDEVAKYEQWQTDTAKDEAAANKVAADKAKAKAALLDKLGITADEAALLLG